MTVSNREKWALAAFAAITAVLVAIIVVLVTGGY